MLFEEVPMNNLVFHSLIFIITVASIAILARYATKLGLIAVPGEHRQHQYATPVVGGLGMLIGVIAACLLFDNPLTDLLPSLILIGLVGAIDDRFQLPAFFRFIAQGCAAYLMIETTGVQLTTLGHLVSEYEVILNSWSVPLTIFAVIGVINAVNMSDGHDGLAGCLAVIVITALCFYTGNITVVHTIIITVLLGFLVWNLRVFRQRAVVFMGDSGSTMLGLILAHLLISNSQDKALIFPVTALWLLALPLVDAVAVLIVRPLLGRSPFSADRMHYHHQLVKKGLSINQAVLAAVCLQLAFILAAFLFRHFELREQYQFFLFMGLFVCYCFFLIFNNLKRSPNSK